MKTKIEKIESCFVFVYLLRKTKAGVLPFLFFSRKWTNLKSDFVIRYCDTQSALACVNACGTNELGLRTRIESSCIKLGSKDQWQEVNKSLFSTENQQQF